MFLKFLTVMIRIPMEGTQICGLEDYQEVVVVVANGLGSFLTSMKVNIVPEIWTDSKNCRKKKKAKARLVDP